MRTVLAWLFTLSLTVAVRAFPQAEEQAPQVQKPEVSEPAPGSAQAPASPEAEAEAEGEAAAPQQPGADASEAEVGFGGGADEGGEAAPAEDTAKAVSALADQQAEHTALLLEQLQALQTELQLLREEQAARAEAQAEQEAMQAEQTERTELAGLDAASVSSDLLTALSALDAQLLYGLDDPGPALGVVQRNVDRLRVLAIESNSDALLAAASQVQRLVNAASDFVEERDYPQASRQLRDARLLLQTSGSY